MLYAGCGHGGCPTVVAAADLLVSVKHAAAVSAALVVVAIGSSTAIPTVDMAAEDH
jgi:hypothetical protein